MGEAPWISMWFCFQFGLLVNINRYNNGIDVNICIPFFTINVNTAHRIGTKKEIFRSN